MIMIICAIRQEAKPFLKNLENRRFENHSNKKVYHGTIDGISVMLCICGVGMKKAAITAQKLIKDFNLSHIIMSGTAGGINSKLKIGDTVVSEELVYHEGVSGIPILETSYRESERFKPGAELYEHVQRIIATDPPDHKVCFGRISTGKKFVQKRNFKAVAREFDPLCADMESTAVAQICKMHSVPFIAVRSISDTKEKSGVINFFRNVKLASNNSFVVVRKLLSSYISVLY